jgi:hypothetical protein
MISQQPETAIDPLDNPELSIRTLSGRVHLALVAFVPWGRPVGTRLTAMLSLRSIVARNATAASSILRRPIHSTSTLRNAAASDSDIYSKLNDGERAIYDKLKAEFGSKTLDVVDVSGMLMFCSNVDDPV